MDITAFLIEQLFFPGFPLFFFQENQENQENQAIFPNFGNLT